MRRKLALLTVPLAAVAIAACGSSSSSSTMSSSSSSSSSGGAAANSAPASTTSSSSSMAMPMTSSSSSSSAAAAAPSGKATTLHLAAAKTGALMYSTMTLSAKAGKVTIDFSNPSAVPHNVSVQKGTSGPNIAATPTFANGSKSITMNLTAGKYTFYCSVPGHRQGGMVGTLTVS
jgi:plastocyanin